jgi:uncharacterized damage-inducible protein DinB
MSKLEYVREMYAFNEWANDRILSSAAKVPEAALKEQQLGSYTTIIADLAHIIGAQVTWLGRWRTGKMPGGALRFDTMDSLAEVRSEAERSHRDLRVYFAGLSDADVDADGEYELWINPDWPDEERAEVLTRYKNPQVWPRWKMFHHVANHGTYHRGEIALCLTALGESPGELDFLNWQRSLQR